MLMGSPHSERRVYVSVLLKARMNRRAVLACLLCLLLFVPCRGGALSPNEMRGHADFVASVSPWAHGNDATGIIGLGVLAESAGHSPGARADVIVTLPPDFQIVEGQSSRKDLRVDVNARRNDDQTWRLRVRPRKRGDFVIQTRMRIQDGPVRDECEWDTKVHVADTTLVEMPTEIWSEREEGGKRYRYGGRYMVLMDRDDPRPLRIDQEPEAVVRPEGHCDGCASRDSLVIPIAITVGRMGTVTWIVRPEVSVPLDPRVIAAAEGAVRKWRFKPATAHGIAVAEWAIADVVVRTRGALP